MRTKLISGTNMIAELEQEIKAFKESSIKNRLSSRRKELKNEIRRLGSDLYTFDKIANSLKRTRIIEISGHGLMYLEPNSEAYPEYPNGLEGVTWEDINIKLYYSLSQRIKIFLKNLIQHREFIWFNPWEFIWILEIEDSRFHDEDIVFKTPNDPNRELEWYEEIENEERIKTSRYWRSKDSLNTVIRYHGTGRTGLIEKDIENAVQLWLQDNFYINPGEYEVKWNNKGE